MLVEIDPQISTSIATNVKEWLTPGNSNNFDYQNFSPAYRAAEIEFTHPSELKLVKDVEQFSYLQTIEWALATIVLKWRFFITTRTYMPIG